MDREASEGLFSATRGRWALSFSKEQNSIGPVEPISFETYIAAITTTNNTVMLMGAFTLVSFADFVD